MVDATSVSRTYCVEQEDILDVSKDALQSSVV
jgi:hypothetical protein